MFINLLFIASYCKNKAVLISGSSGWINYRFESDIWTIYQKLIKRGFNEKDIILACYDDVANNVNNSYKGKLFNDLDHKENVYGGKDKLNYKNKITLFDITTILSNLDTTEEDNLFIYYESHGILGFLLVPNQEEGLIDAKDLSLILISLSISKKFKNCLFCIEACYSGYIGSNYDQFSFLYGVDNIAIITSATEKQTSVSSKFDYWLGNYLSTQFTSNFLDKIQEDQDCTVNDLFEYLSSNAKGSNPTFHGSENIKKMKISDFIGKETSSDDVKLAKKNLLSKNKKVMSSLIISPKDEMMNVNGKEKSRMDLVLDKMFNKVMSLGLKQKKKTDSSSNDYIEIAKHFCMKFGPISESDFSEFLKINEISKMAPKEKIIEIIDELL